MHVDAIRFHLDEHVACAVADALRRKGIDVTTTADAGLEGAADVRHLEFARGSRRVIVTCDRDYLVFDAESGEHAGIVYWTGKRPGIGYLVERLIDLWSTRSTAEMAGDVVFV